MDYHFSFGPNLGLTHNIEDEASRHGAYRTHYVTIGRLHLIISRRIRCPLKQENYKPPSSC